MTVRCPVDGCDYTGDYSTVCSHFAGKNDSGHTGSVGPAESLEQVESGSQHDPSGGDGGDNPLMDSPDSAPTDGRGGQPDDSPDSAPDCCNSPDLQAVQEGRHFTTEDGRTGITEPGDKMCVSCSALHSDGEVFR